MLALDGSSDNTLVEHASSNRVIDFAPDHKHLLFQSDRSGTAGIYSLLVANGAAQGEPVLVKQEAGMFSSAALAVDGTLFYSLGEQSQAEIFTVKLDAGRLADGNPQVFSGPSGMTPESGAWSPDGLKLAYLSARQNAHGFGEAAVTIRTLASGKEVAYKMPPALSAVAGWSADGRSVYTVHGFGNRAIGTKLELHSVLVDTGADTKLTEIAEAAVCHAVRPAPDGNALLIAFGGQPPQPGRPAGLVRLDLQTGQQTEVVPRGVASEMTLSPDGTQIAALDRGPGSAKLLTKPLTGGEWKTLATLEGTGYMYPQWMPNGTLIFGKEGFPNSTLFRIAVAGGAPQKIGELPFLNHVHEIRVHPDGRQLLFQSFVTHTELWALENFLPKDLLAH
jgi:Tol biopolymer transport system component